jgi:hypothetical protein
MKRNSLLIAGLLAASATLPVQLSTALAHNGEDHSKPTGAKPSQSAHPQGAHSSHSAGAFKAAQTTWADVRTGVKELDAIVASKKLSAVHEAAFNVRDSVRELRGNSKSLPAASQKKLDALIRQVDALASKLDETGDKGDLKGTLANHHKLHGLLNQIVALYPKGTLQPIDRA